MEHNYETNIKCPYCDWEDHDSWEFEDDEGTHTCGDCEKEFNVSRNIEVTYSSTRLKCEDGKHNYQLIDYHLSNRKFIKTDTWESLPEDKWGYYKIMFCDVCEDKDFVKITKEEYDNRK